MSHRRSFDQCFNFSLFSLELPLECQTSVKLQSMWKFKIICKFLIDLEEKLNKTSVVVEKVVYMT